MPEQGGRLGLVAVLLHNELRSLLRDRRTLFFSLLLPLAVMPLLLFASLLIEEKREQRLQETIFAYALTGSEAEVELARGLIAEGLSLQAVQTETRPVAAREVEVEAETGNDDSEASPQVKLLERQVDDPESSLERAELAFFLQCLDAEQARQLREKEQREREQELELGGGEEQSATAEPEAPPVVPLIRICYREDRDQSQAGARRLRRLLDRVRWQRQGALLADHGFAAGIDTVARLQAVDLATGAERAGSVIGKFLTAMLIGFILMGGSIVATDTIAGEKERGTLETLLTTAASRIDIVAAKQLAILVVALVVTLTQVGNLLVYIGFGVIPVPDDFAIQVSVGDALLLLLLFLPAAALVSNILLLVSGRAKTYKEAQLYLLPLFFSGLLLSCAAVLPGIELRSAIVALPIANTSVAVREVLVGTHDWLFLTIGWLLTAAVAAWTSRATMQALSTERLITANDSELVAASGPERFPRQVLRWFTVIWVLLFLGAHLPAVGSSIERQVLFNIVLLFGGGTWLMLRHFRLDARQALALRAPRWPVWPAVLVGVPAAVVVGNGVFRLANLVFPVPERMIEDAAQHIMPEETPLLLMVLLIVLAPGVIEELFFRGILLHGLHRQRHPVTLCLVVGLIFGLFHVSLFRIIPVGTLGVILSAITLLTGSVFPAMLWHALYNLSALLIVRLGIPLDELGLWHYLGATIVLATSFWVLYRHRTPYPGLRPMWRRQQP